MAKQQPDDPFKDIPALANPTTPSLKRLRARLEGRTLPRKSRPKQSQKASTKSDSQASPPDPGASEESAQSDEPREESAGPPVDDASQPAPKPFKPKLSKPHDLIARARAKAPEPNRWGYMPHDPRPKLDMSVSSGQKRHALIVLDRLFKALEAEGLEVAVLDRPGAQGTFALGERWDKAQIRIAETYEKVPHTPTKRELADKEWFGTRIPKYDQQPTGQLTLYPGGVVDFSSEESLNALIAKAVDELKQQIAEQRQKRELAEASRRAEAKREQERRDEKERVDTFRTAAEKLDQYRKQMAYIEEVRRCGRVPDDQRREGQTLEQWLRWAEEQARRIHPLGGVNES